MSGSSRPAAADLVPLTPVVFHILAALAAGIRHGYAIAGEVEEVTGGRVRMGPGTLYGSLQRMRKDGLIAEAPDPGRDATHGERRRYYRLTAQGRAALEAEARRLEEAAGLARRRLARGGGEEGSGPAGAGAEA